MKYIKALFVSLLVIFTTGCITKFVPETDEDPNLLVVEGLITNQPEVYTIKLSRSMPLGKTITLRPLKGCTVKVLDDFGNTYNFKPSGTDGIYVSDKSTFQGVVGRKYTLVVNTNSGLLNFYSYKSIPMEMKPVPEIDSLYYEKVIIQEQATGVAQLEGSQIYLNTYDPEGKCKFFRWDYTEVWRFRLPYFVTNQTCWVTNISKEINIKNTSILAQDKITRFPIKFISNETDRLSNRYSFLTNQYSLNEDEYTYWEKLKNISQDVGSLYDITPSSIQGNVYCVEDPTEQVLGYFSVSGKASKRIYIDATFRGLINLYKECPTDTIFGNKPIDGLNSYNWIIEDQPYASPPYKVITNKLFCADCTTRGTTTKPDFWIEKEK